MIRSVVSVFDASAGLYGQPFFTPTTQVAMRQFINEVQRASPDNQLYTNPVDFDLYQVAHFDDQTGCFSVPELPIKLMRGIDVANGVSK